MSEKLLDTRLGPIMLKEPENGDLTLALQCLKMALERREVEMGRALTKVIEKLMQPPIRVMPPPPHQEPQLPGLIDPHPGAEVEAPDFYFQGTPIFSDKPPPGDMMK